MYRTATLLALCLCTGGIAGCASHPSSSPVDDAKKEVLLQPASTSTPAPPATPFEEPSEEDAHALAEGTVSADELLARVLKLDASLDWKTLESQGFARCAAFDADGTLWSGDISYRLVTDAVESGKVTADAHKALDDLLLKYGEKQGATPREALDILADAYKSGRLYEAAAKKAMTRHDVDLDIWPSWNLVFVGWEPDSLEMRAREIFEAEFSKNIFSGTRTLLESLRKQGFRTVVVSAAIEPVVRAGARALGFAPEDIRGMRSRLDHGRMGATIQPPILYRAGKSSIAEQLCGGRPFMAFGDSAADSDQVMLEASYLPVAVEPFGKHLELARSKKWFILKY